MKSPYATMGIALIGLALASWQPAVAEDEEPKLGWSSTAELSFVLTAGNSESTTLGFGSNTERKWTDALLQVKLNALRVETTSVFDFAIGTGQDDFIVPELTAVTAENYSVAGKYDRNISDRFFWYAAVGWLRNEFAGIRDRYVATAGVGNSWYDRERFSFRTNYGVSYTSDNDLVESPFVETDYAGLLFLSNLKKKFGKSNSEYGNDFVVNYSLADSDNWRWTMDQWVATTLTDRLAIKVSLLSLYNNVPALRVLELRPAAGAPPSGTVVQQLDELDTIFSISLVLNF